MTKKELIETVASQTGISISDTASTIEAFISAIKTNVAVGKPIFIRGFGTFKTVTKAERKARDIKKNEEIVIPARKVPTFKISKNF